MSDSTNMMLEQFKLLKKEVLSHRIFDHKGMKVEEYEVVWDNKARMVKLIWIRSPGVMRMLPEGKDSNKDNPFVHSDFVPSEDGFSREASLRRVQEKFDQYWKL